MVTRDDVTNAYRFILGREPENKSVVEEYVSKINSIEELRDVFFNSYEFESTRSPFYEKSSKSYREDLLLLGQYMDCNKEAEEGYLTDFMGIRHSVRDLPQIAARSGERICKPPVPDDTFHAETIEYIGLFKAIEEAENVFTMAELGAGWAPWLAAAGVACQRKKKFSEINLLAIEGASDKIPLIQRHLTKNGLRPESDEMETFFENVHTKVYEGVVNSDGSSMKFPKVSIEDYGASLIENTSSRNRYELLDVQGYTLGDLLKDFDVVDYIHHDIQGYEQTLIENAIGIYRDKVKFLGIGTHSRKIEGCLIEFLYENNFKLLREKPCDVLWPDCAPQNFINITQKDGMQIWRNLSL